MIAKRLCNMVFDLRHPWWTFTREVALIHCRRTGQKLVPAKPVAPAGPIYNIQTATVEDAFLQSKRRDEDDQ